jgi:hypothetical protein
MAVIRQTTRVTNTPIGVVRSDRGEAKLSQAIINLSSTITDNYVKIAANRAQRTGEDMAMAAKNSDLTTIDLNTGLPTALNMPPKMGLIAKEAYTNVINQRYEGAINEELTAKAIEIAKKYPNPNSFEDQMSKYVAGMVKGSDGNRYGTAMQNAGADVMSKVKTQLEIDAAAAAKKKLEFDSANLRYTLGRELRALSSNGIFGEEFSKKYGQLAQAVENEFLATGNASNYFDGREELDTFSGSLGQSKLLSYSPNMTELEANETIAAIRDTTQLNLLSQPVREAVVQALMTTTPEALASQFEKTRSASQELLTDEMGVDEDFRKNSITAGSSFSEVEYAVKTFNDKYPNASKEKRDEVTAAIRADAFIKAAGLNTDSVVEINALMVELQADQGNFNNIVGLFGGPTSNFAAQQKRLFESLSRDEKKSVAKHFENMIPALRGVEAEQQIQIKAKIAADLYALGESASYGELNADTYEEYRNKFKTSGVDNPEEYLEKLDLAYSESLRNSILGFRVVMSDTNTQRPITSDEAKIIQAEVLNEGSTLSIVLDSLAPEIKDVIATLKDAARVNRSAVATQLGSMVEAANNNTRMMVEQTTLSAAIDAVKAGTPTDDQIELYDKTFTAGVNLQNFNPNAEWYQVALSRGVMLPTITNMLTTLATSGGAMDVNVSAKGFAMAEQLQSHVSNGRQVDLLRIALKDKPAEYGLLNRSIQLNRMGKTGTPADAFAILSGYEGDSIEKDMKTALDNKSIEEFIASKVDSNPLYNEELKSALMLDFAIAARDKSTFNQDRAVAYIKEYVNSQEDLATRDNQVIGAMIGSKSVFARFNFMEPRYAAKAEQDIMAKIIERSPNIQQSLGVFGTVGLIRDALFGAFIPSISFSSQGKYDDIQKAQAQAAGFTMDGIFAGEIVYDPIESTFAKGDPQWVVMLRGENGITIPQEDAQGNIIILRAKDYEVKTEAMATRQAYNNLNAAANSIDGGEGSRNYLIAEIRYLSTLSHLQNEDGSPNIASIQSQYSKQLKKFNLTAEQILSGAEIQ